MSRFRRTALLLSLAMLGPTAAAGVEITYLGNEGFLLAAGEDRVLIDALFGEGLAGYPAVPPAVRQRAEAAEGPFAAVDLVLASHHHPDHFAAGAVARHLAASAEARFAGTEQAAERLRRAAGLPPDSARAVGLWPAEGERREVTATGINAVALHLHHGRERDPPVQNLGWLIEIGGLRILHVGDTEATLEDVAAYALGDERIDVALLAYWLLTGERWRPLVEAIGAGHLVAMHLPSPEAPSAYFEPAGDLEGLRGVIAERFPGAWIPTTPMSARTFGPPARPVP